MGSLDDARLSLSRALGLRANGEVEKAESHFSEAKRLLEQAISEDPTNAQAHSTYARLLESRHQYDDAKAQYQRALELDPTDGTIQAAYEAMQTNRQRAEEQAGFEEEMMTMAESAKSEKPVETEAPTLRTAIEKKEPAAEVVHEEEMEIPTPIQEPSVETESIPREADEYWALGLLKAEEGDLSSAEEAFKQALDLAKHHVEARKAYSSLLLDQQRYTEAEDQLAALMAVDPSAVGDCLTELPIETNASLLALRGALYVRKGEAELAEPLLRKALELEPDHTEWIVEYATLLDDLDRPQEAVEQLQGAFEQELDASLLHRAYARLMAELDRYDEVEQHLKRALEITPEDPETLALQDELRDDLEAYKKAYRRTALAQIKARNGFDDEARELFEEALQIDKEHLPTLKAYATFLEQRRLFDEAEAIWAIVATQAPEEAEGHFQTILDARGENSETLNGMARVLIQLDRTTEAEEWLQRSLQLDAENAETLHLLINVLEKQDRRWEAEKLLQEQLDIVKMNPKLSLRYAQILANRGDYDRAKKFFRKAQSLAPYNKVVVEAYKKMAPRIERFEQASGEMAMGWMAARDDNVAEAERWYKQALSTDPEHVPTLRRYAQLLEETDRSLEASRYVSRLAKIDPEAAEAHYLNLLPDLGDNAERVCAYGLLLQELGRLAKAREKFELALDKDPTCLEALNPYVKLLLQEDQMREAEGAIKQALDKMHGMDLERERTREEDNAVAELHWRYAEILISRHRHELARSHLERATSLSDDPRFEASYGRIADKLDQIRDAELAWASTRIETDPIEIESLFKEAYAAYPDHVPTLVDYGEFLIQQGRHRKAQEYLEKAVALDPYEERAKKLLTDLKAMPEETTGFEERSPLDIEGESFSVTEPAATKTEEDTP